MIDYDDTHPCSECGTLISYLKSPPDSATCEVHQAAAAKKRAEKKAEKSSITPTNEDETTHGNEE